MAGYIFTLDSKDALYEIAESGVYSTKLNIPVKNWGIPHEGTFADYYSMKPGDNIYFFHKRNIYGIGKLININDSCIHLNFPEAQLLKNFEFKNLESKMILDSSEQNLSNRLLCTFDGNPCLFKKGVDMDDVLASNPNAFRMLRAFWKLSFIKLDDIENKALFDYILKANEKYIDDETAYFSINKTIHKKIAKLSTEQYKANSKEIVKAAAKKKVLKHEMAIEAAIINYITRQTPNNIFGNWDYVTHQLIASPFKPIDYMDKMDIFGYRYIEGYSTISKYLMMEIKKDAADTAVINQALKYVDWIEQEYSHDYSMIAAFIVASDFPEEVINLKNEKAKRFYVKGRPAESFQWRNLRLIKYQYDEEKETLVFEEVN